MEEASLRLPGDTATSLNGAIIKNADSAKTAAQDWCVNATFACDCLVTLLYMKKEGEPEQTPEAPHIEKFVFQSHPFFVTNCFLLLP